MFTYTIVDQNPGTRETITASTKAEALRQVAELLIGRRDNKFLTDNARAAIDAGVVLVVGHKAPRSVYLADEPEAFWFRIAETMTTDDVDFFEGLVADWEDHDAE